ncbi:hypothetical protein D3874_10430 [Oleomonas cavernae]|uniref:Uncharacterized protein n=1 Tax=Oleomonas cavernae TaxID=2320859 RepID=A0A418WBJ3_9PROT|nr:hypothetical protein D3874_10430 [Oleomonas cavernae]
MPGYRTAQAAEDGRLIVDLPGVSRVPAGWTGPRTLLSVVDLAFPRHRRNGRRFRCAGMASP